MHGFYHWHGGLLYTVKELFARPEETLHSHISGKRIEYFNPFTYLVLISLAGGFFYWSGVPDHLNANFPVSGETLRVTGKYFSYRLLLTFTTYAIMGSIIYKSYKCNLAEHLIINTFLISQCLVLVIVWMLVSIIIKPWNQGFEILFISAFCTFILYQIVVFFRLFNTGKTFIRWIKAFTTVIMELGLVLSMMNFQVKIVHL